MIRCDVYFVLDISCFQTLTPCFNKIHITGIVVENLKWMYESAKQFEDRESIFNGFLLFDEMGIHADLQVLKKGDSWELVGAIDLGPLLNELHVIHGKHKEFQLATHCFQYIYQSYSGFRCKTVRTLMWKGHFILWEHFERAYHFNNQTHLHLYRHLSRDHIYPKLHEKMRITLQKIFSMLTC